MGNLRWHLFVNLALSDTKSQSWVFSETNLLWSVHFTILFCYFKFKHCQREMHAEDKETWLSSVLNGSLKPVLKRINIKNLIRNPSCLSSQIIPCIMESYPCIDLIKFRRIYRCVVTFWSQQWNNLKILVRETMHKISVKVHQTKTVHARTQLSTKKN